MSPISPQNYRGITFIRLDNLPSDQRSQIGDWMPAIEFIKIKTSEEVIDHCVSYQDYLHWLENFYMKEESYESEI